MKSRLSDPVSVSMRADRVGEHRHAGFRRDRLSIVKIVLRARRARIPTAAIEKNTGRMKA